MVDPADAEIIETGGGGVSGSEILEPESPPADPEAAAKAAAAAEVAELQKKLALADRLSFLTPYLEKDPTLVPKLYAAIGDQLAPRAPAQAPVQQQTQQIDPEAWANDFTVQFHENPGKTVQKLMASAVAAFEQAYVKPRQLEEVEDAIDSSRDKYQREYKEAYGLIAPDFESALEGRKAELAGLGKRAMKKRLDNIFEEAAGRVALKQGLGRPVAPATATSAPTGERPPTFKSSTTGSPARGQKAPGREIPSMFVGFRRQAGDKTNADIIAAWDDMTAEQKRDWGGKE
jgi:hypothetical protein